MNKNLRNQIIANYQFWADHADSPMAPPYPALLAMGRMVEGTDSQADVDLVQAWVDSL